MSVLEFPYYNKKHVDVEDLWHEMVDNFFWNIRKELEKEKWIFYSDYDFNELTLDIWSEISDVMLTVLQEDFVKESDNYVLAVVKQRITKYRDNIIEILEKWIVDESEFVVKDNVVSLFK